MGTMIAGASVIGTLFKTDATGRTDFGRIQVQCMVQESELLGQICGEIEYNHNSNT